MVSLTEKASSPSTDDALVALTAAMNQDVSSLVTIDEHDPLGIAFYVYAITYCKFASHETNELALAARFWVDEKLAGSSLSAYKDRDIAAIALLLYSFNIHGSVKDTDARFAGIVEPFIEGSGGVFSNFFTSVLVGMALLRTNAVEPVTKRVAGFVNGELERNWITIRNDPKNLPLAYWWGRETRQPSVIKQVLPSAKEIAANIQPDMDSTVYSSYVLLEEAKSMSRKERHVVRETAESALRAITSYTTESVAPALAAYYGNDSSRSVEILERYRHELKPRFSRILVAIGLITEFLYVHNLAVLLSTRARTLQIYRGSVAAIACLLCLALVYWLGSCISLPVNITPLFKSGDFISIVRGVCFLLADLVFWSVVLLPLNFAVHFIFGLIITGRFQDEAETIGKAWSYFTEHYRELIFLPVLVTVLTAIFHP